MKLLNTKKIEDFRGFENLKIFKLSEKGLKNFNFLKKLFIIALLTLTILVSGCADISAPSKPSEKIILEDIKTEEEKPAQETVATPPTRVELSLSKAPALDETTEITATVWYTGKIREHMYNSEVVANITLPEGFELVNGNPTWKGYLKDIKDKPQQFSISVKAIQTGNWTIKARAGREHLGSGFDYVYISVLEDKGIISEESFPLPKREDIDRAIKLNDSQIPSEKECTQDSDCKTGGCSGTVCQSKDVEPIFTTCEWKEEYACYKQINCKCIDNKCQWDKTEKFEECISEARETLNK